MASANSAGNRGNEDTSTAMTPSIRGLDDDSTVQSHRQQNVYRDHLLFRVFIVLKMR